MSEVWARADGSSLCALLMSNRIKEMADFEGTFQRYTFLNMSGLVSPDDYHKEVFFFSFSREF